MPTPARLTVARSQLALLVCLLWLGLTAIPVHAADPWITEVTGLRQDQRVAGIVHVQTHVTGLDPDADYDLRYQVDGPSGFIDTARDLPFVLKGAGGWNTAEAVPGEYTLHAFLIRNHKCIAFRVIDFYVVDGDSVEAMTEDAVESATSEQATLDAAAERRQRQRAAMLMRWQRSYLVAGVGTPSASSHPGQTQTQAGHQATGSLADDRPTGSGVMAGATGLSPYRPQYVPTAGKTNTQTDDAVEDGTEDTSDIPQADGDVAETTDDTALPTEQATEDAGSPNNEPVTEPDPAPQTSDPISEPIIDQDVTGPTDITEPPADVMPLPEGERSGFLGINLAEVTYYTREWVFVDAMKQSRPWLPTHPGSSHPWDSGESLQLNAQGYPLLRNGQAAHTLMLSDMQGAYPAGRYVCTFEGDGEIAFAFDAKVINRSDHRIELAVEPSNNGIYLRIDRSNPADPVRNVKVWMPGFENAESPFHPLYLERLKPFSVIRFMDWMHTNGSNVTAWSDRPDKHYYTQGAGKGVALEYMIELCNELGADPWFCMPHMADDAYVYSFAKQVRQRLRPDLNVYVEWSNEVWNSDFPQHKWVQRITSSESLSDAFRQRWADEAARDFGLWRDAFGEESGRVIRVAASQKDNPWITEKLLEALDGQFDAVSCSTYFGFTEEQANRLYAGLNAGTILDWAMTEMSRSLRRNYQRHGELARLWSDKLGRTIPLIGYEGGQHYTDSGRGYAWANALIDVQRDRRMYNAYMANLREWKNAGGSLFTAFNFVEKPDKWGSWGQLEFMDQDIADAPKYRALLEFNAD